jgi:hypothetical protein
MRLGRHGACRHEGDERQRGVMRTCTRKGDGALEAHGRLPSRQRRRSAETLGRKAEVDMVMACGRGRGAVLQFWGWVRFVWVRLLLACPRGPRRILGRNLGSWPIQCRRVLIFLSPPTRHEATRACASFLPLQLSSSASCC